MKKRKIRFLTKKLHVTTIPDLLFGRFAAQNGLRDPNKNCKQKTPCKE